MKSKTLLLVGLLFLLLCGCTQMKSPVLTVTGTVVSCRDQDSWNSTTRIDVLTAEGELRHIEAYKGAPACSVFKNGGTWTVNYHRDTQYDAIFVDWVKRDDPQRNR